MAVLVRFRNLPDLDRRHPVVGLAVEVATGLALPHAAPLLEEERHAPALALVADGPRPGRFPPSTHPGMVVARLPPSWSPNEIASRVVRAIADASEALGGAITIIEASRIRIFGSSAPGPK